MYDISRILPGFGIPTARSFDLTAKPIVVARPVPTRPVIYFANPSSAALWLWLFSDAGHQPTPNLIVPGGTTLSLTWSLDGPMTTHGYYGAMSTGTGTIRVTEVWWNPSVFSGGE